MIEWAFDGENGYKARLGAFGAVIVLTGHGEGYDYCLLYVDALRGGEVLPYESTLQCETDTFDEAKALGEFLLRAFA